MIIEETLRLTVGADEYLDKLVDHSMMKIYAIATVQETKQTWAEEDDFVVDKPKPGIKVVSIRQYNTSFRTLDLIRTHEANFALVFIIERKSCTTSLLKCRNCSVSFRWQRD